MRLRFARLVSESRGADAALRQRLPHRLFVPDIPEEYLPRPCVCPVEPSLIHYPP